MKQLLRHPKIWGGWTSAGLMILITSLWTLWGASELYYEAWGLPLPEPLYYLAPSLITLSLTLLALKWPRWGGGLIMLLGAAFTFFIFYSRLGHITLQIILSWFPLTFLTLLVGFLFIWGGRAAFYPARLSASQPWWRRQLRYRLAVGLPIILFLGISAWMLPQNLMRVDDGHRGARRISGNGVDLVWAPAGPGWNWQQSWGGYPSWDMLAFYGVSPVGLKQSDDLPKNHATQTHMDTLGLCRYLDASGLHLMSEPQNIWRMPTTHELVQSLVYRGENAHCHWSGKLEQATCDHKPDKETPLWAPDEHPIYMWTGDEFDETSAYFVSYNGWIKKQPKDWGNPRHGYRCVRAPE